MPEEEESGTSPMTWIAGIIAIIILALAGFFVFQLLSGDSRSPSEPVTVPNFGGLSFTEAQQLAADRRDSPMLLSLLLSVSWSGDWTCAGRTILLNFSERHGFALR